MAMKKETKGINFDRTTLIPDFTKRRPGMHCIATYRTSPLIRSTLIASINNEGNPATSNSWNSLRMASRGPEEFDAQRTAESCGAVAAKGLAAKNGKPRKAA
jgi:hypothetical protein